MLTPVLFTDYPYVIGLRSVIELVTPSYQLWQSDFCNNTDSNYKAQLRMLLYWIFDFHEENNNLCHYVTDNTYKVAIWYYPLNYICIIWLHLLMVHK